MKTTCSIQGCGSPHYCKGMCIKHYLRVKRHGSPYVVFGRRFDLHQFLQKALEYDGDDCMMWPEKTKSGYGTIGIGGRTRSPARHICEQVNGPPPSPTHEAAHSCGKGKLGCVTPRHLSWKTPKENSDDKKIHGTFIEGEKSYLAKLTNEDIMEIRNRHSKGNVTYTELAKEFGITVPATSRIVRKLRWKHIE